MVVKVLVVVVVKGGVTGVRGGHKIMFPSTGPLLRIGLCYLPEIWKPTRTY